MNGQVFVDVSELWRLKEDLAAAQARIAEGSEWFWRIVDANGLADLPSDEAEALRLLLRKAARLAEVEKERDEARAALKRIEGYTQEHGGAAKTLKEIRALSPDRQTEDKP